MMSGLGGRGRGGRRPRRHQQLPEVIVGQFGPEDRRTHTHIKMKTYTVTQ